MNINSKIGKETNLRHFDFGGAGTFSAQSLVLLVDWRIVKKIPLCTCVINVASPVSCFNVVKELFSNAENTHRWNSVTFCQIVHLLRSPSDTVVQLIPIKLFDLFPSTTPQWIIRLTDVCILPVHTY